MRRDYTQIGEKEGYTRGAIDAGILSIEDWIPTTRITGESVSLPMMQGMAINEAISQLKLPKVSEVAIFGDITSGSGHAYGLYGIKCEYKNEFVTVYIADDGCDVIPVAMDVTEKPVPCGYEVAPGICSIPGRSGHQLTDCANCNTGTAQNKAAKEVLA